MNLFSRAYRKNLNHIFNQLVPRNSKVLKLNGEKPDSKKRYDYVFLINSLSYTNDAQEYISQIKANCHTKTRVVVIYFNFFWKPILDFATFLNLRKKDAREPNWLTTNDIKNFFRLEDFEVIKSSESLLAPIDLGLVSDLINRFIAPLPLINNFCLNKYLIFRSIPKASDYSVSIIIPARNEEGHMRGIMKKIPKLGTATEVIFVEGHSKDNTFEAIKKELSKYRGNLKHSLFKQQGKGKADAVRLGFKKAKGDILMILDADLTVDPKDLNKFYNVLAKGYGDFANGSRLVYPMEKQAMRTLNYFGNKLFSLAFTYLLGQRIKDTLCGTKVLFRSDYLIIVQNRHIFGDFDPFGDFDLLFGATKLNLKIVEVPIRYKERIYGETNINRLTHGLLLLKMTVFAAMKIKFT